MSGGTREREREGDGDRVWVRGGKGGWGDDWGDLGWITARERRIQ